jgi:hypothetical protein
MLRGESTRMWEYTRPLSRASQPLQNGPALAQCAQTNRSARPHPNLPEANSHHAEVTLGPRTATLPRAQGVLRALRICMESAPMLASIASTQAKKGCATLRSSNSGRHPPHHGRRVQRQTRAVYHGPSGKHVFERAIAFK